MNKKRFSLGMIALIAHNLIAQELVQLDEIIITSTKYEEKLINIASSAEVINTIEIEDNSLKGLKRFILL